MIGKNKDFTLNGYDLGALLYAAYSLLDSIQSGEVTQKELYLKTQINDFESNLKNAVSKIEQNTGHKSTVKTDKGLH